MKTKTILSIFAVVAMMMASGWASASGWQSSAPAAATTVPLTGETGCEKQALKECGDLSTEDSDCNQKYNTCMTGLTAIERGETFCQDGKNACLMRTDCYYHHVRACIRTATDNPTMILPPQPQGPFPAPPSGDARPGTTNPLTNVIDDLPTSVDHSARPTMGINREHVTDPIPTNTDSSVGGVRKNPLGHVIDPAPTPVNSDPKVHENGDTPLADDGLPLYL